MKQCSFDDCLHLASKCCLCQPSPVFLCQRHLTQHFTELRVHEIIDTAQAFDCQLLYEPTQTLSQATPKSIQPPPDFQVQLPLKRQSEKQLEKHPLKCTVGLQTLVEVLRELSEEADQRWQIGDFEGSAQLYKQCVQVQTHLHSDKGLARTLNWLGGAFFKAQDYSKAIGTYQHSISIYAKLGLAKLHSSVLYNLGLALHYVENYSGAIAAFQESLKTNPVKGAERVLILYNLGNSYCKSGCFAEATQALSESLNLQKQFNLTRQVAYTLYSLGQAFEGTKLYEKARQAYANSLHYYSALGNVAGLAQAWRECPRTSLAFKFICKAWLFVENNCKFSLKLTELATCTHEPVLRHLSTDIDETRVLSALGSSLAVHGRIKKARWTFHSSAHIARNQRRYAQLAQALVNEAGLLGTSPFAISLYQEATELYSVLGLKTELIDTINSYGLALSQPGSFALASETLAESIRLSKLNKLTCNVAFLYENYSLMFLWEERLSKAISTLKLAIQRYTKLQLWLNQANAFSMQAEWLDNAQKHEKAVHALQQAIVGYKRLGMQQATANALFRLGDLLGRNSAYAEAARTYFEASEVFRQLKLHQHLALALIGVGRNLQKIQQHGRAIIPYQEAIFLYRGLNPRQRVAALLSKLATALFYGSSDYSQAVRTYEEAVELCRQLGLWQLLASTLTKWGTALFRNPNSHSQAVTAYQEAASIYQWLGCRSKLAAVLSRMADNLLDYSHEQAVTAYTQAIELYRVLCFKPQLARTLRSLGRRFFKMQKLVEAIKLYKEAKSLYSQLKMKLELAETLEDLIQLLEAKKRPGQAVGVYQQLKQVYSELGHSCKLIETLEKMGKAFQNRWHYLQSIEAYTELCKIYSEMGLTSKVAETLTNMGSAFAIGEKYTEELRVYLEAIELHKQLKLPQTLSLLLNSLGNVYVKLHKYLQATRAYQEACDVQRTLDNQTGLADSLRNLGNAFKRWGKYSQAINAYEEATELFSRAGQSSYYNPCSVEYADSCAEAGQYDRAIALYSQTADSGALNKRRILIHFGLVLERSGQVSESIQRYQEAVRESRKSQMQLELAEGLLYLGLALDRSHQYAAAKIVFEERATITY